MNHRLWQLRITLSLIISFFITTTVQAENTRTVVVYDLEARGIEPYLASSFTDLLCVELNHIQGIKTRCKSDIVKLMEHTAERNKLGCNDETCLLELSTALGADHLLHGSITKIGNTYALIVSRINVNKRVSDQHFKDYAKTEIAQLLEVVPRAARWITRDLLTTNEPKQPKAALASVAKVSRSAKAGTSPAIAVQPMAPPPASASTQSEISAAVEAWRQAWEGMARERNLGNYRSLYSKRFYSEYNQQNFEQWMADKATKLEAKANIAVQVEHLRVFPMKDDGQITATFMQTYRSTDYSDRGLKILAFARENNSWKIVKEEWRQE